MFDRSNWWQRAVRHRHRAQRRSGRGHPLHQHPAHGRPGRQPGRRRRLRQPGDPGHHGRGRRRRRRRGHCRACRDHRRRSRPTPGRWCRSARRPPGEPCPVGPWDYYAVRLSKPPTGDVRIDVGTDEDTLVWDNVSAWVHSNTLTFTPANWHIAQLVQIRAEDDTLKEALHFSRITNTLNLADAAALHRRRRSGRGTRAGRVDPGRPGRQLHRQVDLSPTRSARPSPSKGPAFKATPAICSRAAPRARSRHRPLSPRYCIGSGQVFTAYAGPAAPAASASAWSITLNGREFFEIGGALTGRRGRHRHRRHQPRRQDHRTRASSPRSPSGNVITVTPSPAGDARPEHAGRHRRDSGSDITFTAGLSTTHWATLVLAAGRRPARSPRGTRWTIKLDAGNPIDLGTYLYQAGANGESLTPCLYRRAGDRRRRARRPGHRDHRPDEPDAGVPHGCCDSRVRPP